MCIRNFCPKCLFDSLYENGFMDFWFAFKETCLTCCFQCWVYTKNMCAITTTVYRCWPSVNSASSSTSCCAATRRKASAKDAHLKLFWLILCTRLVKNMNICDCFKLKIIHKCGLSEISEKNLFLKCTLSI